MSLLNWYRFNDGPELESDLLLRLEENLTLTAEQRSFILLRLAELGISCSIPHLEK